MSIRLNKVTKECNVGLQTAVEFLQKKGFSDVEANPNTKISDEQYQMLVAEFKKDKGLRDDAAIISRKRQHKEKKATIALPEEKPVEIKTATEAKLGKGPKVVGRIDLDNLGARKPVAAQEKTAGKRAQTELAPGLPSGSGLSKKETPAPARPAEVKAEAPIAEPAPKQEEKPQAETETPVSQKEIRQQEKSKAIGTETDGVFRLNHTAQVAPQLKVKGHIDLAALNQSTRPKKKTKEEKRKEREEKNRQAGGDRSRQGGTGQNASEGKKKRVRIGKERVDVNAVAGQQNGKKRDNAPGANQQGGGKHNKNKNRQQPVIKAEVSDEDVAKQVKETLARLTNKSKAGKGAKYRKEKRENARASMEEQLEDGTAAKLTKKEALDFQRHVEKLNKSIGGIKDLNGLPDALFIVDVGYHKIAVQEANKLGIPVIGVVDTNGSPDGIDYVIPGNDDSSKAVQIYAAGIADAVIAGRADSAVAAEGEKAADEEFVEVVEAAPAEAPAAE